MRELFLIPEKYLPPITEKDREFSTKIQGEYNLPEDEISWLIRDVRDTIQNGFQKLKEDSRLKETYQNLFSKDTEIKEISIKTTKNTIKIKPTDSIYDNYLKKPLSKMQRDFRMTLDSENDYLTSWAEYSAFTKIMIYLSGTGMNDNKSNIALFDFIQYFKIGGPVNNEEDWKVLKTKGKTKYQDYKHYKASTVRSRKLKFQKDYNS